MADDWTKRYRWVRTWPGEVGIDGKPHEDYSAYDGEEYAGRIFFETAGPTKGLWRWAGSYPKRLCGTPLMPNAGYCKTAALAAQTVEDYGTCQRPGFRMAGPPQLAEAGAFIE